MAKGNKNTVASKGVDNAGKDEQANGTTNGSAQTPTPETETASENSGDTPKDETVNNSADQNTDDKTDSEKDGKDNAGKDETPPAPEPEPEKEQPDHSGLITTEAQAIAHVKANYQVPEKCAVVIVTEDRNVFWQENQSSAVNHAQKNKLKLFRLSCQDLAK